MDDVEDNDAEVDDRVKLKKRFLELGTLEVVGERCGGSTCGESGGESGPLRDDKSLVCAVGQRVHGVCDSAIWPQPECKTKL